MDDSDDLHCTLAAGISVKPLSVGALSLPGRRVAGTRGQTAHVVGKAGMRPRLR